MKNWKLPLVINSDGKPSATLFFAYTSFVQSVIIVSYLTSKEALYGATASLVLFFVCLFIYRLNKLDKIEIDLENKTLSLDGVDDVKNV